MRAVWIRLMDVYLGTLGCRLNESEIGTIGRRFLRSGHRLVASPEEAAICVVNTCAVTREAERKTRQLVKKIHRKAPGSSIVLTGCFSELHPAAARALPGVERVVSNRDKDRLVSVVTGSEAILDRASLASAAAPGEIRRTRAFVKVQDGCDQRCTFCVTTLARGPSRSRDPDDVLREVQALLEAGFHEVVLTGVHLGSFGRDLSPPTDLGQLIQKLLSQTDLPRLRLSSLEPWDIPEGFLRFFSDRRICRHLHMPLQAGCDDTLRRMARRTRKRDYRDLVRLARAQAPDLALTTDVMVGFPGESDRDFAESYHFVRELDFSHLHVFRYSARPGTLAAGLPDQVSEPVKILRGRAMKELAELGRRRFARSSVGRQVSVLWEREVEPGIWQGLSDSYLRVRAAAPGDLHNRITDVVVERAGEDGSVEGKIVGWDRQERDQRSR